MVAHFPRKILSCHDTCQIPNTKSKRNSNHQIPSSHKVFSVIGNWQLFGVRDLSFGVYDLTLCSVPDMRPVWGSRIPEVRSPSNPQIFPLRNIVNVLIWLTFFFLAGMAGKSPAFTQPIFVELLLDKFNFLLPVVQLLVESGP
jgi:hypothetical protein